MGFRAAINFRDVSNTWGGWFVAGRSSSNGSCDNLELPLRVQHKVGMKYGLKLATPEPFYAESHRTLHFQNFAQSEDVDETAVDREDLFT